MNSLPGTIEEITTEADISLVKVLVQEQLFYSIIIDTPTAGSWLKEQAPVRVLFKETEVMIARETITPLRISVRNQLHCRISSITAGAILCELTLDWDGGAQSSISTAPTEPRPGARIRSIITRNACEELGLQVSDAVIALIKTNEISLAYD